MTYDAREKSTYQGAPFELYLFQTGGEFWALTSGDVAREYLGKTYTPETIVRTEVSQSQENKSGEIKVEIPRAHEISLRFVPYMPTLPMSLVIYRGHDGEAEIVTNYTGRIVKADFGEMCELSVVPESDLLRRSVPIQQFQPQCNHVLFQPIVNGCGCGVDKTSFRVSGALSYVSGTTIKSAAFAAKTNGWFNNGYAELGDERRMILNHVGDTLTLISPFSSLLVGDTVLAYAGCKRNRSDCLNKFDNLLQFWGFDRIPSKNLFDGGLL